MPSIAQRFRPLILSLAFPFAVAAALIAADAAASGQICTSADTFMFGNRAVGSTTTANATVTNCGDAPWSFTDVSIHPSTGPAFQVTATCKTGLTLAPGGSCTVGVRFAPTSPGQTSGGLWLHNTTITPDQLITFYGRGIDGENGSASLSIVPGSVDFAPRGVGTQSPPLRIDLHNAGPAAMTLRAIVLNGPAAYDFDYGLDDTCGVGATIAPGATCHKSLVFRPQSSGVRRANLVIDSPQLASLAILQVSGVAQAAAPNYQGIWGAPDETGWGVNLAHQGDVIFASWFTYDASGKPVWFTAGLQQQSDGSFAGAIDLTHGPPYKAETFDSTLVTHTTVGSGRLAFSDSTHALFSYTVNGVSQVRPLSLFVFATPVPACTFESAVAATRAVNYQDMWYVPAESGWGINFTHQGDVIFASWFVYGEDGNPGWVSAALTKTGARTYAGTLDTTTGPRFDAVPFDSARVTHASAGSATVTFTDGANATFVYTLNGVSRTKFLARFVFRAPGTVCQ